MSGEPRSPGPAPDRAWIAEARERAREASRTGPRTRILAVWLLGLAILEGGQAAVRVLASAQPLPLPSREPPIGSVAAYLVTAALLLVARRALLRGARAAAWGAVLAAAGIAAGTYAALNTATLVPIDASTSEALVAVAESWRGVGAPGMLTHADAFRLRPTGLWRPADLVAAAFALSVSLTAIGLASKAGSPSDVDPRSPRARGLLRASGGLIAVHVSLHACLTAMVLVGLLVRAIGRS